MALIDKIRSIFRRSSQISGTNTADEMHRQAPAGNAFLANFSTEQEHKAVVLACRKMYKSDPRARGVIKTVARDAVKGGCTVRVKNNPRAEEAAGALIKRLRLNSHLDDWARLTLRDGDSLIEIGVNDAQEIVNATRKPTLQMRRNSNDSDRFDDPERAYWYAPESWVMDYPPEDALWFADWQIIHARWDHDEGNRYGSPLFESSTSAWKRMTEGELDIAVRRKTRAGMKFLHVLDGATPGEIEEYKAKNQDALDNPFAAVADFFSNRAGSISVVQGDANLSQIEDVMHHIRTWWMPSPVPMALMGYGQDLNRDVLEEQSEQYRRALEQITQWVEDELVVPLLERQWLLAGILPEGLDYEIIWKIKSSLTAADLRDAADAALRLMALGLGQEAVFEILGKFLPGIDLSALASETEAARMGAEIGAANEP
jgi:hypothetical protein